RPRLQLCKGSGSCRELPDSTAVCEKSPQTATFTVSRFFADQWSGTCRRRYHSFGLKLVPLSLLLSVAGLRVASGRTGRSNEVCYRFAYSHCHIGNADRHSLA